MHKSYFKNFISTALLVIVSFFIIGCAFAVMGRRVFVMDSQKDMIQSAQELGRTVVVYSKENRLHSGDFRTIINTVGAGTSQSVFLTDETGKLLLCSEGDFSTVAAGGSIGPSVLAQLDAQEPVTFLGTLDGFFASEHYIVATPVVDENGTGYGYLFVAKATTAALDIWEDILPLFILISGAVVVLALILSFASSRYLGKPLREMAAAARKFGRGDYSVRVSPQAQADEIGELTEAFNTMADSLEKEETRRREFIANVSHELKTPMTTISGFADGILDGTIPPESQNKYLHIISSETKRLSRLVRSMLELSRLQAEDSSELLKKSFSIDEVLRRTLINFVDKIENKHLDVDFDVPELPMAVSGDADAITQVVYNLVDNAIKFASEGSTLRLSLWKDDTKAHVSVQNQGSTIPESEIPLLFDRFHKSDRSRSRDKDGVGLGLYIVKTIIDNHGEKISVTSHSGTTEFTFTLALKPEKQGKTV